MKNSPEEAIELIADAHVIGLMTHINGDGDAFGSLLGLRNILEALGKKVIIFSNEPLPKYLEYRKKEASYSPEEGYYIIDLLIGLDVSTVTRFTLPAVFDSAKAEGVPTIVIDHHAEGDIYDKVSVAWRQAEVSSTAEMIYWLAKDLSVDISRQTAEFLLWGLETDTYFLSNPNVFESTERARKALWELGASTDDIKRETKAASITSNAEFMKFAEKRLVLIAKSNIAYICLTAKDKSDFGIHEPISSSISNYFEYFKKPRVMVVLEQRTPEVVKVSMRSNFSDVDVSKVAAANGGGGHVKAAGFEVEGTVEEFVDSGRLDDLLNKVK